MSNGNGGNQFLGMIAQYTKDLSFENINPISQVSTTDQKKEPHIDVNLKVNVKKTSEENTYNVSLAINVQAKLENPLFVLELIYCGDFSLEGFKPDITDVILYVECPRLLFPFARNIVATAISEGGFPPLYLAPINFVELYQQQRESKKHIMQ